VLCVCVAWVRPLLQPFPFSLSTSPSLTHSLFPLLLAPLQAVGEPPFFLGASVFFALKEAVYAAREANGLGKGWFQLDAPATPERLRMLCADALAAEHVPADFRAKISC
jgi:hypothetical protein